AVVAVGEHRGGSAGERGHGQGTEVDVGSRGGPGQQQQAEGAGGGEETFHERGSFPVRGHDHTETKGPGDPRDPSTGSYRVSGRRGLRGAPPVPRERGRVPDRPPCPSESDSVRWVPVRVKQSARRGPARRRAGGWRAGADRRAATSRRGGPGRCRRPG